MQHHSPISMLQWAVIELVLATISFMEFINEYIKIVAAIAATVTFVFALIKFIRDERDRKRRNKLTELQIENEVRKNTILKKESEQ